MKVKIGIFGANGRMGRELVRAVIENEKADIAYLYARNEVIIEEIKTSNNIEQLLEISDVIIDFSSPTGTIELIEFNKKYNKPLVIGTTGFNENQKILMQEAQKIMPILYRANFSKGVDYVQKMLSAILPYIAKDEFDVNIIDHHHRNKKDAPSGTALAFAEFIKLNSQSKISDVPIVSIRGGQIPGEQVIEFLGDKESIIISHTTHTRSVFADGAVSASIEFVINK
jgi:4-hydroxy-tetrahydrodipicolinate reductase